MLIVLCLILRPIIIFTKTNSESLSDFGKKIDLDINAKKSKFMFVSRKQNAGQNYNSSIK